MAAQLTLSELRSLSVEHKVRMLVKTAVKTIGAKSYPMFPDGEGGSVKVKVREASEFKDRLFKVSVIIARVGFCYSQMVDATRLVNGQPATFDAKPRKWGQRIGATVSHNGQDYVECIPIETINVRYFVDNDEVPFDSIKEHIYNPPSKVQEEHQGLDKEHLVMVRDYKWMNVVSITYAD